MAGVVSSIIGGGPGQIAAFSTYYMGASAQPASRDTRRYRGEAAVTAAGRMESNSGGSSSSRGEVAMTMTRRWNESAGEIFFHGCRKCGRGHTSVLIPARPTRPYEIFHGYMERQRYIFCRINALPELGR